MQTFLPYPDFARSAACLDNRRLGKQRVEAAQILRTINLANMANGWRNHPAVNMWRGFTRLLCWYGNAICLEWKLRGFIDNQAERWFIPGMFPLDGTVPLKPNWLGDKRFHSSHRAALLFKDPTHYGQFGWTEEPAINYWWPTKEA